MHIDHPLIKIDSDTSLEDLQSRVSELTKKLNIANRMGNRFLADQVRMALTSYQTVYQDRLRAQQDKLIKDAPDYSDRIDIS
jgi:hypothetical protein